MPVLFIFLVISRSLHAGRLIEALFVAKSIRQGIRLVMDITFSQFIHVEVAHASSCLSKGRNVYRGVSVLPDNLADTPRW